MIITDLICLNIIVTLVLHSGFWDSLDEAINKKFPLRHLPHLLQCGLCQCWWLSLLYILVSGQLSLFNIVLCLVNAHLTKVTLPVWTLVENAMLKIIEIINRPLL